MVLELQVHNQLEPLLWGLLLGEEGQGQDAKERARVWGFQNPLKGVYLQLSEDLPPATTSKHHISGDQDFIIWTFGDLQYPDSSSFPYYLGLFRGTSVQDFEYAQKAEYVVYAILFLPNHCYFIFLSLPGEEDWIIIQLRE